MFHELDLLQINPTMRGGVLRYLMFGTIPGGFLQAVIRNDLVDAAGRADRDNITKLHLYAGLLYNYFPSDAHGSGAIMEAWSLARQERPWGLDRLEIPPGWEREAEELRKELPGAQA